MGATSFLRLVATALGAAVVLACAAVPTATPSPSPTATATPVPTATVTPTATAVPTAAPTPVPRPSRVKLTPSALVLRPLESKPLTVAVLDDQGNAMTGYVVFWEVSGEGGATVEAPDTVKAGTRAGTYTITARALVKGFGTTVEGTASLVVEPGALARVEVAPRFAKVLAGDTLRFEVTLYDQYGNSIPAAAVRWRTRNEAGKVDQRGVFTAATQVGMHADAVVVEALEGTVGRVDRATVSIVPGAPFRIELLPGQVALLPGQTRAFAAKVFDVFGNLVTDAQVAWRVAHGGGSIDEKGLFTADVGYGAYGETVVAEVRQGERVVTAAAGVTVAKYLLGPIVFEGATQDYSAVSTMGPDGGGVIRLTSDDKSGGPAWSPDGSRIAYGSTKDGNPEIYVMNADGTGEERLTDNFDFDGWPTWSPSGDRIAFSSDREGGLDIFVMNADGTDPVRLTENREIDWDYYPYWSPKGEEVLYTSDEDGEADGWDAEAWTIGADGTNKRQLTDNKAFDLGVGWYPDGSKILFSSDRDGQDLPDLYVMNPDGSDVARLTLTPAVGEVWAAFSPDGTEIVFTNSEDRQIWVMDAGGKNARRLSQGFASTGHPQWRPDPTVPVRRFVIGATVLPLAEQTGPGVQFPTDSPGKHLAEEERYTEYTTAPPTSGPHWVQAAPWGIYASPIANERQVANLAQGGVVIQYNTRDQEVVSRLEKLVKGQKGFPCYVILAPNPDMPFTIALTAWGVRDTMGAVDEKRMQAFIDAYVGKGPEPASCVPDAAAGGGTATGGAGGSGGLPKGTSRALRWTHGRACHRQAECLRLAPTRAQPWTHALESRQ